MSKHKPDIGTYSDKIRIEKIFQDAIIHHSSMFDSCVSKFQTGLLFHNWRKLIRCVEELINIPNESEYAENLNSLELNFLSEGNIGDLMEVSNKLLSRFDKGVAVRFNTLAFMASSINLAYKNHRLWDSFDNETNLSVVWKAKRYFQSRRLAYGGMLNIIPYKAKGQIASDFKNILNDLNYWIDTCLVGFSEAYYHLLINECLNDYEITFDGEKITSNFHYKNLEGFFLEPDRLSLLDQLEFRPNTITPPVTIAQPSNSIFSFNEIANQMALFENTFSKYSINQFQEFKELNQLFMQIARNCEDNYNVVLSEEELNEVQKKLKKLRLTSDRENYSELIDSYAPFTKFEGKAYSTVVLLSRYITRTLAASLMRNRSYLINSGYVFEDKVGGVLSTHGYMLTDIVRIERKEFDLITIKNGKVYNFQCKNNYIDIARTGNNYKLMARLNSRLIRYYERAIIKEVNREELIIKKTGINDIKHFVISRYPVITRNPDIINFNTLENWLNSQSH